MRMGKTVVVLIAFVIPAIGWCQSGPRITFDKQSHDYGKVTVRRPGSRRLSLYQYG